MTCQKHTNTFSLWQINTEKKQSFDYAWLFTNIVIDFFFTLRCFTYVQDMSIVYFTIFVRYDSVLCLFL